MEDEEELKKAREKSLQAKKAESQLKMTLRLVLEDAAYDRLMNVALANKELYIEAAKQSLMASKRIGRKIKEDEVLMILKALKGQSAETKIVFHKK